MTPNAMYEILRETGLPVAYIKFKRPEILPFLAFSLPGNDDYYADDTHYVNFRTGWLELYSEQPDFTHQKKIEDVLTRHGIFYSRVDEDYIESEEMYLCLYRITVQESN